MDSSESNLLPQDLLTSPPDFVQAQQRQALPQSPLVSNSTRHHSHSVDFITQSPCCPICHNRFRNAIEVYCRHVFCRNCLIARLVPDSKSVGTESADSNLTTPMIFLCPVCHLQSSLTVAGVNSLRTIDDSQLVSRGLLDKKLSSYDVTDGVTNEYPHAPPVEILPTARPSRPVPATPGGVSKRQTCLSMCEPIEWQLQRRPDEPQSLEVHFGSLPTEPSALFSSVPDVATAASDLMMVPSLQFARPQQTQGASLTSPPPDLTSDTPGMSLAQSASVDRLHFGPFGAIGSERARRQSERSGSRESGLNVLAISAASSQQGIAATTTTTTASSSLVPAIIAGAGVRVERASPHVQCPQQKQQEQQLCAEHSKPLTLLCEDCVVAICTACVKSHQRHALSEEADAVRLVGHMYNECGLHLGVQIRSIGEHLRALETAREQQNVELAARLKRSLAPLDCLMRRLDGLRTHMVALLLRVAEREPLRPTNRSFEQLVRLYEVSCRLLTDAIAPFEKLRLSDDLVECASTLLQLKTLHKQLQVSSHGLYSVNVAHSTPNPSSSGLEQQLNDLQSRLQLSIEAVDAFVDATNGALPNSVLSSIDFHTDSSDSGESQSGIEKPAPILLAPSGEPMTPPPMQMLPRKLMSRGLREQSSKSGGASGQEAAAAALSSGAEVLQLQRSAGQLWQRFESALSRHRSNSDCNALSESLEPSYAQATLLENVRRSNTITSPLLYTQPSPPPAALPLAAQPPLPFPFSGEQQQNDYSRLYEGYATGLLPDQLMTAFNAPSVSPNTLMAEMAAAQQGIGPRSNSISSMERRQHTSSLNEASLGPNVEQLLAGIGLGPPDQPAAHLTHRYRTATDRSEGAASEECNSLADRASARPSLFLSHPSLDSGLESSGRNAAAMADAGQRSLGSSFNMQAQAFGPAGGAGLSMLAAATTASAMAIGSARGTSVPLSGFGGPAARTQAALAALSQQRYPPSLLATTRQSPVPLLHTQVVPPRNLMSLASAIPEGLTGADENLNNAGLTYTGTGDNRVLRKRMRLRLELGGFGNSPGELWEPNGLAVNTLTSEILVADTKNNRMQVFSCAGKYVREFGSKADGKQASLFCPSRVAINRRANEVAVLEPKPSCQVRIFSADGRCVRKIGQQMLVNPKAVCVDAEGRLLVVESHVRRLHLFDWYSERARPINRLELGETLDFPVHLAVNNRLGRIYIADHNAHAIKAFDYSGRFLFAINGEQEQYFTHPKSVRVDPATGHLFVGHQVGRGRLDLTEFDEDGKLVHAFETDQVPRSLVGMWDMDIFRELSRDAGEDAAAAGPLVESEPPCNSVVYACRNSCLYIFDY